jgi:hypothetical protein
MPSDQFDFSGSLETWLETLPRYQQHLLQGLVAAGEQPRAIPQLWFVAAAGGSDTAPFGGRRWPSLFYEKFLDELHKLLCSEDPRYATERKTVMQQLGVGRAAGVAEISAVLGQHLGAAGPFLAPAVAVSLYVIGLTGLRAWCAAQGERAGGSVDEETRQAPPKEDG